MTGNTNVHLSVTNNFKKGRGVDQKTSQYLIWPPFASCSETHLLSHRADQAVDCGLCNVVPLLFNGCE